MDRSLLTKEEKQIGVDNIKVFLLSGLTFLAHGKNVLADGNISIEEGMSSLTLIMIQMPQIKKIEFAQIYPEFKDLDESELDEILEYLHSKGGAIALNKAGLLELAEATFQAIAYTKFASDKWIQAFKKK